MGKRGVSSKRGFSLTEAIVALTLAGAILAGLMGIINGASRLDSRADTRRQALAHAELLMEQTFLGQRAPSGKIEGFSWTRTITVSRDEIDDYHLVEIETALSGGGLSRPVILKSTRIMEQ